MEAFCQFLENCICKSGYIQETIPFSVLFSRKIMLYQGITWAHGCAQLGDIIA